MTDLPETRMPLTVKKYTGITLRQRVAFISNVVNYRMTAKPMGNENFYKGTFFVYDLWEDKND